MINDFIDLFIENINEQVLRLLNYMGYRAVVTDKVKEKIQRINGIVIVKGLLLSSRNEKNLRAKLRGIKEKYAIILIEPLSTATARFAAHDSRVDGITLTCKNTLYIDPGQAGMMKQYSKPLILPLKDLVECPYKIVSRIFRRIIFFRNKGIDIIPVSKTNSPSYIMNPITTPLFLSYLFGLDKSYWLYSISNAPREILVRNGVKI